jgi:hypothetical protein
MRFQRSRLELRMKLTCEEPRMIGQLHNLHEVLVRRDTGNDQTVFRERLFERPVEFIPMTMTF